MAARVEHGVEIVRIDLAQRYGVGQRHLCLGITSEAFGGFGLGIGLVALRVERRLAALGRSQGDLRAGIDEHVIRRGELLEPEAGFLTGIAELVVGCQHHQDLVHASGPPDLRGQRAIGLR